MEKIETTIENPSGFMLVNKNTGPTSHDIVDKLRRLTGIRKIGHAGTLDPFASGLLVIAIGRQATKQISDFVKLDKRYVATLKLGETSTTLDPEGEIEINKNARQPSLAEIEAVLSKFTGPQEQIPPMYSAKKVGGKKLYQLARAGISIERVPAHINILSLGLLDYKWPSLIVDVRCSSGTYIRTLAGDIGEALATGAYLEKLERTEVGEFKLENSVKIPDLNKDKWTGSLFSVVGN